MRHLIERSRRSEVRSTDGGSGVGRAGRVAAISVLAGVLGLASGCGSSFFGGGGTLSSQDRVEAYEADDESFFTLGFRSHWRNTPIFTEGADIARVSITDAGVAVLDSASRLSLMDAQTGRNTWSRELTDPLTEFVGLDLLNDRVLAATQTELFVVSIEGGSIDARQDLERIVVSEPTIVGDIAVFGTANGELLAQRTRLGFRGWGSAVGAAVSKQPAKLGELVCAISERGDVLIVDANTGRRTGAIKIFGGPGSEPIAGDAYFYAASLDYSLYAFNPQGGDVAWRERTQGPITTQPIYHNGVVYIELEGDGFVAFDAMTGERLWAAPDVSGTAVGMSGRNLLVWDGSAGILLDPQRGDVVERVELPGIESLHTDAFEGGNLYAVSAEGVVARYQPRF